MLPCQGAAGLSAERAPGRAGNLLQLACTVLNAQSATVAAPSREAVHCVGADGLTLLGAGPRARPGAAARLGACRAAAAPSSATLVDGPLSRWAGALPSCATGAPRAAAGPRSRGTPARACPSCGAAAGAAAARTRVRAASSDDRQG